ncbi:MAG: TonB-dependent receptor plug domain-containing protein [Rhodospirillaceae bacterium]
MFVTLSERRHATKLALIALSVCTGSQSIALASDDLGSSLRELRSLSIDELANLEITSVSRRPENLRVAARNVYVITSEQIEQSGVATLPQALALAPNLQVAAISSSAYAITARGLNIPSAATANKLLVLIDGRTVYTPLYSGVYWDVQDVPLDDIDRIEVVSGPGGTLWGANAVNGVINVSTRRASAGDRSVSLRGGTFEYGATARNTFNLSETAAMRVYANAFDRAHSETTAGDKAYDSWRKFQTGARLDFFRARGDLTVQGDFYTGYTQSLAFDAPRVGGGNLLARWVQRGDRSTFQAQAYYDRAERFVSSGIKDKVDTVEVSLQQNLELPNWPQIVWGGSYRIHHDRFMPGPRTTFLDPAEGTLRLASIYGEATFLLNNSIRATIGTKLESNSYTGIEYLPNARVSADLSPRNAVWTSVARSVRTPSRFDRDIRNLPLVAGGPEFQSETVWTYEAGYRTEPLDFLNISATIFYNDYGRLRTAERTPASVFPLTVANNMDGSSYGVEAWANIALSEGWRMSLGGNYLKKNLRLKAGSLDFFGTGFAGNDPSYQLSVRSYSRLSSDVDLYLGLRAIDELPNPAVPAYVEADATVTWRVTPALSIAVSGLNLLHNRHTEFVLTGIAPVAITRSGYVTVKTSF